ncbi:MAG: 50S ribosomal protein L29 [Lentisphaerae bacterium]|jgi:large subunit ribosomal protein L29|nr:50S ribosomal protein L29 [Lentisphaerota bacterium]MBR4665408.1 50S ribosomal protein L29 [Lentisphaeria bacterium]
MKNKISFKDMTDAELDSRIAEFKKEKFNYRAQAKAGQIENPAKFKELRRNIARILTEKKRRELAAAAAAPAAN